jgi:hypothetical protein
VCATAGNKSGGTTTSLDVVCSTTREKKEFSVGGFLFRVPELGFGLGQDRAGIPKTKV